jgi:hypothetical protein
VGFIQNDDRACTSNCRVTSGADWLVSRKRCQRRSSVRGIVGGTDQPESMAMCHRFPELDPHCWCGCAVLCQAVCLCTGAQDVETHCKTIMKLLNTWQKRIQVALSHVYTFGVG